jgi:hypothetical protein
MEEDDREEKIPEEDPLMKRVCSTLIIPNITGAEVDYRSSTRMRKQVSRLFWQDI